MSIHHNKHDELILVVPRTDLFPHGAWSGLKQTELDTYITIIQQHKTFIPRHQAEYDPNYKQIIPYLIFMYQDSIFVMQRTAHAREERLRNKYSIGIGGHIRQEDMHQHHDTTIFDWAQREFHEEVVYSGSMTLCPLGILNDDSDQVGQVHAGLVLLIKGDSPAIHIRSELKSGDLLSIEQCMQYKYSMESWSSIVLEELLNQRREHEKKDDSITFISHTNNSPSPTMQQ